jgi:hypothetical protein
MNLLPGEESLRHDGIGFSFLRNARPQRPERVLGRRCPHVLGLGACRSETAAEAPTEGPRRNKIEPTCFGDAYERACEWEQSLGAGSQ